MRLRVPERPDQAVEALRSILPEFRLSAALPCRDGSILVTVDTGIYQYIGRLREGSGVLTLRQIRI